MRPHAKRLRGNNPRSQRREMHRLVRHTYRGVTCAGLDRGDTRLANQFRVWPAVTRLIQLDSMEFSFYAPVRQPS